MPTIPFNEAAFIKLVFLLADTQQWVDELSTSVFEQLPLEHKKKLFRPLTGSARRRWHIYWKGITIQFNAIPAPVNLM